MSETRGGQPTGEPEPFDPDDEPLDPDDEPLDPDEAEPEEPADEPAEPEPARPAARPGRAASREATLSRRLREAEDGRTRDRDEYQRTLGQIQARLNQPPHDPAAAQREADRVALMSPQELVAYTQQQIEGRVGMALQQQQFATAELLDRQSFDQLCREDSAARRLKSEVERTLNEERQQGRNPPREVIYTFLYGKEMRERAQKAGQRQRAQGGQRINAQTARPGSGRSGTAAPARGGADDVEAARARMRGVIL